MCLVTFLRREFAKTCRWLNITRARRNGRRSVGWSCESPLLLETFFYRLMYLSNRRQWSKVLQWKFPLQLAFRTHGATVQSTIKADAFLFLFYLHACIHTHARTPYIHATACWLQCTLRKLLGFRSTLSVTKSATQKERIFPW